MISFSFRQTMQAENALSGVDGEAASERRAAAEAAQASQRLNRLLAEFRLYGGFGGPDGMRLWGEVQRTVREIDRQRDAPYP